MQMQSQSLIRQPPSELERLIIHEQFIRTVDWKGMSFKSRTKPENAVWMSDSKLKNLIVCQPEVIRHSIDKPPSISIDKSLNNNIIYNYT